MEELIGYFARRRLRRIAELAVTQDWLAGHTRGRRPERRGGERRTRSPASRWSHPELDEHDREMLSNRRVAVVAQTLAAAGFLRYWLGDTPYFARNSRLT